MAMIPDAQQSSVTQASAGGEPRSGSLADVLDVILDKGIVIDAFVRVSLVGIEILTLDARIVVASVDTYMYFAREAHRLEMGGGQGSAKQGLGGMMGKLAEGGAHNIARGALQGAGEGLREGLLPSRRNEPQERRGVVQRAVGALKDKATDSIREAFSPGDEDEGSKENDEHAEDSGPSPPAPSRASRRSRRRQPASEDQSGSQGTGSASQGGQGSSEARRGRRAAPPSRRAPSRGDASD